jgi:hypothetical protein
MSQKTYRYLQVGVLFDLSQSNVVIARGREVAGGQNRRRVSRTGFSSGLVWLSLL